jgi:hypothetical protein
MVVDFLLQNELKQISGVNPEDKESTKSEDWCLQAYLAVE